jgi:adenine deaminase
MKLKDQLSRRVDAALGRIPCDLIFRDVQFVDIFNLGWVTSDVAVIDGVIAIQYRVRKRPVTQDTSHVASNKSLVSPSEGTA